MPINFFLNIKTFFFFSLMVSLFALLSCGVPEIIGLNDLLPAPYEIEARTENRKITFTIRGLYSKEDYSFFNGYNLYYGLTSSRSQILRQKLYVGSGLPTVEGSPTSHSSGEVITEVSISRFRYVKGDEFEIKQINLYESYFFIVRPFNGKTSREGDYHNVVIEVRPSKKERDISRGLGTGVISHETIHFILNPTPTLRINPTNGSLIQPAGFKEDDFYIKEAPEEGYSVFSQPISEGSVYFFKEGSNFGLLYVRDLNGGQIKYDFYYQKDSRLLL